MSSQITALEPDAATADSEVARSAPRHRPALEFKGLSHPALRVIVNDASGASMAHMLATLGAAGNHGFEWQPVIIDASRLSPQDTPDWTILVNGLRALRLHPVGLAGAAESSRETAAALQLGWLTNLPEPKRRAAAPAATPTPPAPPPSAAPAGASRAEVAAPAPAPSPPEAARQADPLVIDRPVRSGQQVYARDRDLIVIGGVSPGAEVIADGHVHIYGPLGGRAIAGARGRRDASIFALALQAELVAVSGIYRTFEDGLPAGLAGKPVRIGLEAGADTLAIKGL